jgi:hypothetical protein
MIPQEAWSGYKPSVAHLQIFGCVAYSQVPEAKRGKHDDEESKAYKLYNPLTNKGKLPLASMNYRVSAICPHELPSAIPDPIKLPNRSQ